MRIFQNTKCLNVEHLEHLEHVEHVEHLERVGNWHLFEESVDLQFDLVARVVLQRRQFALCLLKLLHRHT